MGIVTGLRKEICWTFLRVTSESLQEAVCHLMIIFKKYEVGFPLDKLSTMVTRLSQKLVNLNVTYSTDNLIRQAGRWI